MVKGSAQPAVNRSLGPGHFRFAGGPGLGFRVEPTPTYLVGAWGTGVVGLMFVVGVYMLEMPFHATVIFSVGGAMTTAWLVAALVFLHRYDQSRGPYLVVDRHRIRLRDGRCILLRDFVSFEIRRRWEATGDGVTRVAILVLRSNGTEDVEVLVSVYYSEMVRLKRALDDEMNRLLNSVPESDNE